jgi:hypothetical protein
MKAAAVVAYQVFCLAALDRCFYDIVFTTSASKTIRSRLKFGLRHFPWNDIAASQ